MRSLRISFTLAAVAALLMAGETRPAAQRGTAARPPLPTADQIFQKYEESLGGAAALAKVQTRTTQTRRIVDIGEPSDHLLTRYSKRPMLSIMYHGDINGDFLYYNNGCDGKTGWQQQGDNVRDAAASTGGICEQELYFYGYHALDLARAKRNFEKLEVKGIVKIVPTGAGPFGGLAGGEGKDLDMGGARDTYLVLGTPLKKPDPFVWLYFDTQTGFLLRRADAGTGAAPAAAGDNPRITDFIQYRAVGDGTKAPFQFVTIGKDSRTRGVHVSIVDNQPVEDSVFLKPKVATKKDKGL
jgi:hypothetical protein